MIRAMRQLPVPPYRYVVLALIVAMATLGTAHILVRTSTYGAGIHYDSVLFLSIAENIAAGEGVKTFWGSEFVLGAPFFPSLLALISLSGIDPEEAGRLVNAAAFGLVILASGLWLWRTLASPNLALLGTIAILVAYPLNDRFAQLMTEPLFILFTVLALIFLEAFMNRKASMPFLMLAAFFAALAAVTRYPGITVIGTGVFLLLLFPRDMARISRIKYAATFGSIASIPLAGVLVRNRIAAGTFAGNTGQIASDQPLADALNSMVDVFETWIIPDNMNQIEEWIIYMLAGVSVIVAIFITIFGKKWGRVGKESIILPFVLFILAYLTFIALVLPFTSPQFLDERYVLPTWIPISLVAIFLLDRFNSIDSGKLFIPLKILASFFFLAYTIFYIWLTIDLNITTTSLAREHGHRNQLYNTAYWEDNTVLSWVENADNSRRVYSNSSALSWYRSGNSATEWRYHSIPFTEDILGLAGEIMAHGKPAYVVLIEGGTNIHADYEWTIRFLPGVIVVGEFPDGSIYRFPAGWRFDETGYRANMDRYLRDLAGESGQLVASGQFDVYIEGRTLVYIRESCAPADTEAWFFLHIDPTDPSDLPEERRPWGFDSLDFTFDRQPTRFDEKCLTTVDLPDYDIVRIRTGQYDDMGQIWSAEFTFPGREHEEP